MHQHGATRSAGTSTAHHLNRAAGLALAASNTDRAADCIRASGLATSDADNATLADRSGTREQLRRFFEVDRYQIAVAALSALADENALPRSTISDAISRYALNPDKPDPAFQ